MRQIGFLKNGFGMLLTGLFLVLSSAPFLSRTTYADELSFNLGIEGNADDVSYLAQYGTWIDVQPYGSVWQPNVRPGWRPFTYGHWLWTDQGWAWVSYAPYGWLVFHYGTWDYRPDIGWFWIEGSEWSPAPVDWLNYDGYCAWAPLPPVGVSWEEPWQREGLRFWVVVRDRDLDRENIGHYEIHNAPVPRGPNREDVFHRPLGIHEFEKIIGHQVRPEPLKHGPVQVFMNPRHRAEPHAMQQGEIRHGQGQAEQAPPHRAERPQPQINQPEIRPGENRAEENRHAEAPRAENRPGENQRMQLQRMILPRRDQARVEKYRAQFEKKMMVQKNENNRQHQKDGRGRNGK